MAVICLNCEGWGCEACRNDREAARGGDQGWHPHEVEVDRLRAELAEARAEVLATRHEASGALDVAEFAANVGKGLKKQRDEAQQLVCDQLELLATLKAERDALLAQVALLRVPGGAA